MGTICIVATVQAPKFRWNSDYDHHAWLWLVHDLIDRSSEPMADPWSPFACEWRSRSEALLSANPEAHPYHDQWLRADGRKYETPLPGAHGLESQDQQTAARRLYRDATLALGADTSILQAAHRHVEAFGDNGTVSHVSERPLARPSQWNLEGVTAEVSRERNAIAIAADIPDITQAAFSHPSSPKRQAARRDRMKPEPDKPHPLFRNVLLGRSEVVSMDGPMNKIFVVHGPETGPRESVQLLLTHLQLDPIVLEDQANKGRTLIEKFEAHADVQYAVVILTPDDSCAGPDGKRTLRPRQNVILELGYLMGYLGRDRVAALVVGISERPSDVDGLAYIPFDAAGGWKTKLANELREAGFPVDFNLIR